VTQQNEESTRWKGSIKRERKEGRGKLEATEQRGKEKKANERK